MKNSDIQIGSRYECKVSGQLVLVTVLNSTVKHLIGGKTRIAFMVKNERTGRLLKKSAAALRRPLEVATTLRLPPKATQRSVLAIAEVALQDGERAAHFGNPDEKAAVRLLAAAGFMAITHIGRDELYAKLTPEGQARLATLRGEP
jgi:hypothetical protein